MLRTPSDEDSVDPMNFRFLQVENIVQSFAQLSPINIDELGSATADFNKYGCEMESGFSEPINQTGSLELPKYDPKKKYFEGYWRLYLKNEHLMKQICQTATQRDDILKNILQLEQFYNCSENLERTTRERYLSGRKKHNRRCANEIQRQLECPYAKCSKSYASEGSLNLHIKIKHNGGNKTDREKVAKSIVYAKANGIEISEDLTLQVNLPPGIIEKAAEQLGVSLDAKSIDQIEEEIQRWNEQNRLKMKQEELMRVQKYRSMNPESCSEEEGDSKNLQFSND